MQMQQHILRQRAATYEAINQTRAVADKAERAGDTEAAALMRAQADAALAAVERIGKRYLSTVDH